MEHASRLSQTMRAAAERRYDSAIPPEVLAAISAQERIEHDIAAMRGLREAERLRFLAAREFQLAKSCFRSLLGLMRFGAVRRPDAAWFAQRDRARRDAELHIECWRTLRRREQRRPLVSAGQIP